MAWTDERVELLKKLWAEGLSARQIADQLGGVTRNAVIGKVHRLGLSGRATTSRSKTMRPRKKRVDSSVKTMSGTSSQTPRAAVSAKEATPHQSPGLENFPTAMITPIDELVIPLADRVTMETLKEKHCKWPIGDPSEEDFHYCGHTRHGDGVYCEFHMAKAYQPARRSARKKALKQISSYR
ncbi:MAG: GcrA cell cycle regulator [bacterium]|nr:GcrA cell cycle regulator [bacterium]